MSTIAPSFRDGSWDESQPELAGPDFLMKLFLSANVALLYIIDIRVRNSYNFAVPNTAHGD
jgi:hypothetical protein